MDWYMSIFFLQILLINFISCRFIHFENGYEYSYQYTSNSTIEGVGNFKTDAKISFTTVNGTQDYQEILLKVLSFTFVSEDHQKSAGSNDLDFSDWFSFEITPIGEIKYVFYVNGEHDAVLVAKKGFAALLSSKLQKAENNNEEQWHYQTKELGNEGHHNASYTVIKTPEGIQFKKLRHSEPIPNAKGIHQKVLHYDHNLQTIEKVVIDDDILSPQMSPDFDAEKNMRKVKAANEFSTMEYPTMSAKNKGELKFLERKPVKDKVYRPSEDIVNGSIHIVSYEHKATDRQSIAKLKDTIKAKIRCIRMQPEQGSPIVISCFQEIVDSLKLLPDDDLKDVARLYFTEKKPILVRNQEAAEIMIDAFSSLSSDLSQMLLAQLIIRCPQPQPDLVMRLLSHISEFSKPHQSILSAIEDLCFNQDQFPKSLHTGKLHQKALLSLGVAVHKLSQAGEVKKTAEIIEKVHILIGMHDPWVYTVKRSTQTSKEKDTSDQWKVVLLETLGNAGMDSSFEFIMSHINTTNSAWIKRAGLHAMRKYEHDKAADAMFNAALYEEDENVRYEALLLYQAHPKSKAFMPLNNRHPTNSSSIINPYGTEVDIQMHHRSKRGFWDGLEFKLSTPSVDWQKKVGAQALGASFGVIMENYLDLKVAPLSGRFKVSVNDEAYATVHVGMLGFNINFFVAKICYKGETSYDFNVLQEGNIMQFIKMIIRFDKIIRDIVNGIKKGVDLFKEIISGKGLKRIIENFISAVQSLPEKVADLRSRARKAIKTLGQYDEMQLPSFLKPVKNVVHRVEKLFNDVKTDVMTFYNKLDELVNIQLPVLGDKIYKAVIGIIDGFKNLGRNPMSSIFKIGLGVYQINSTYKEGLKLKQKTEEACFFLKGEKPYWWDLTGEFEIIQSEANKAIKEVKEGSQEWINDFKEDPVGTFTKGKYTTAKLREDVKNDIISLIEDMMNPFNTILGDLAGPFIKAYDSTFGVILSIKEAYAVLKKGYDTGKSLLDSVFGSKLHPDFPRKIRLDTHGCRGKGFYPSRLYSGEREYWSRGVDLEISEGEAVVAPFSGYIMLTDNPNEVVIKTVGSLKDVEIFVTNVNPKETILKSTDENYIEDLVIQYAQFHFYQINC